MTLSLDNEISMNKLNQENTENNRNYFDKFIRFTASFRKPVLSWSHLK